MADNSILIEVEFNGQKGFAKLNQDAIKAGTDAGEKAAEGFGKGFAATAAKLALGFFVVKEAIGLVTDSLKESITEAAKEQLAIDQLSVALSNAGRLTNGATESFIKFSEEMAKNTTLADDQVIALSRVATNFARTNEQAQALVRAAADLSAATGIDANSAIEKLGRSLTGVGNGLTRTIPGFVNMSAEALRAGGALEFVEKRFGGSATAEINTFNGALKQATKEFGEVVEASGKVFVQSPAVIAFLKGIADGFSQLAAFTAKAFTGDQVKKLVLDVIALAEILSYVIIPLERIYEVGKVVFSALELVVNETAKSFAVLGLSVTNILNKVGLVSNEALGKAEALVDSFSETSAEFAKNFDQNLQAVGSGTGATSVQDFLTSLQANVEAAGATLDQLPNRLAPAAEAIRSVFKQTESFGAYVGSGFIERVNEAGDVIGEKVVAISINVRKFLVDAIVVGTQTVVKALQAGKNGFSAFSNAVLGIVGNMLIQIGSSLIAIGIGIDALKLALGTLSGGLAIAAGIALVAIGTLLTGLSGGSALEGPTGGGGGGGVATAPSTTTEASTTEAQKPKTEVVVNVEGNIFNGAEQARTIAENLQEYFDTNNGLLVRS